MTQEQLEALMEEFEIDPSDDGTASGDTITIQVEGDGGQNPESPLIPEDDKTDSFGGSVDDEELWGEDADKKAAAKRGEKESDEETDEASEPNPGSKGGKSPEQVRGPCNERP